MLQSDYIDYFDTLEYSIFFTVSLISNVFLFVVFIIFNKIYRNIFLGYIKGCRINRIRPL